MPVFVLTVAAIAFGYFEALLHVGDVAKFEVEEARLISMNNLLNLAGHAEDLYIDFAEEAYHLLRKLAASLQVGNGAGLLLDVFNDYSASMSIITYVKACNPPPPPYPDLVSSIPLTHPTVTRQRLDPVAGR